MDSQQNLSEKKDLINEPSLYEIFKILGDIFELDFQLRDRDDLKFSPEEESKLRSAYRHYMLSFRDFHYAIFQAYIQTYGDDFPNTCVSYMQSIHAMELQTPFDIEKYVDLASRAYKVPKDKVLTIVEAGEKQGKAPLELMNLVCQAYGDVEKKDTIVKDLQCTARYYESLGKEGFE